jgi:hypothetical protein
MSGADVFALDPDEVHRAVEDLFDIESEVDTASAAIKEESAAVASGLSSSGLATGDAPDHFDANVIDGGDGGHMSYFGSGTETVAELGELVAEDR